VAGRRPQGDSVAGGLPFRLGATHRDQQSDPDARDCNRGDAHHWYETFSVHELNASSVPDFQDSDAVHI
jgi:hypothetical protein